ncbi:MAG: alkaline phosphatase family protein [Pirellulales bacterium]|nr:alkaline phosphatase family protein [Pirellulales bacterium]
MAYIGPGAGFTVLSSFFILLITLVLLFVTILTWPLRFAVQLVRGFFRPTRGKVDRVVVVGLDGLDPGRVRRLMEQGRLPNLKSLSQQGTFTELATTLPPISPVAWSTFMTGVNPGKHNIFDFLNRNPRTYLPELSSAQVRAAGPAKWLSRRWDQVRLLRKSQPFWRLLGERGIFSTILRVPVTFPPEKFHGLLLSAMCTPDLRGTQGTFTLFTTDPSVGKAVTGGMCVSVQRRNDRIETFLTGPPDPRGGNSAGLQIPLVIQLDPRRDRAEVRVSGQRIALDRGKDSDWVRVTFRSGWFTRIHGICRFRLLELSGEFRLYVSPIHLDPQRPAMPISHPLYYSMYLAKLHDRFATLGLAEDTWALNVGAIGEDAFLEQAWRIHGERERMFFDALRRTRRGLCVCVFDAPDRIQHMFYRHTVPGHPASGRLGRTDHPEAIDDMYVRMDALVGRAAAEISARTALFVLSDHGFCDFSRGVNLNAWLRDNGYLALHDGQTPGDYLAGVDWTKTRAYAVGLSGIYLNQKGRESQGIVSDGPEAQALKAEIAGRLRELSDPDASRPPIKDVYDSRQVYSGPYVENAPDLVVGYHRGYRASWQTTVGSTADGPWLVDNTRPWSGDHCVDPSLVPGVLFSNRKLLDEHASIQDLAPTILKLLGVPVPSYMDGRPLDFTPHGQPCTTAD